MGMTQSIKLQLSGSDEGDEQLTKRQYEQTTATVTSNTIAATTTTAPTTTTTAVKTFISIATTTKAENQKVKISRNIEEKLELNQSKLCVYRLSKGRISNIQGTVWSIK